jgi:hypothetical protein
VVDDRTLRKKILDEREGLAITLEEDVDMSYKVMKSSNDNYLQELKSLIEYKLFKLKEKE